MFLIFATPLVELISLMVRATTFSKFVKFIEVDICNCRN